MTLRNCSYTCIDKDLFRPQGIDLLFIQVYVVGKIYRFCWKGIYIFKSVLTFLRERYNFMSMLLCACFIGRSNQRVSVIYYSELNNALLFILNKYLIKTESRNFPKNLNKEWFYFKNWTVVHALPKCLYKYIIYNHQ
jgi:hypothetical protein